MMKGALVVAALALWAITWAGTLAEFRVRSPWSCRKDAAFAAGWSAMPPAWVIAPFLTGFYEHGFQFGCPDKRDAR